MTFDPIGIVQQMDLVDLTNDFVKKLCDYDQLMMHQFDKNLYNYSVWIALSKVKHNNLQLSVTQSSRLNEEIQFLQAAWCCNNRTFLTA